MKITNPFYDIPFSSDPYDGIFSHFRRVYGNNLASKGLISLNIRDPGNQDYNSYKLVENDHSTVWYLWGQTNNSIIFNFTNHSIKISAVTIRTCDTVHAWHCNPSFAIESSSDGINWNIQYSEIKSNRITNFGDHFTQDFHSSTMSNSIRFRSLDNQCGGLGYGIYVSTFEFFGRVFMSSSLFYCQAHSKHYVLYNYSSNILFLLSFFVIQVSE